MWEDRLIRQDEGVGGSVVCTMTGFTARVAGSDSAHASLVGAGSDQKKRRPPRGAPRKCVVDWIDGDDGEEDNKIK